MRRLRPRPKQRLATPIPDDLRESLREALEAIRAARRDSEICIDYDDAIQTPNLCGGRTGGKKAPFQFTYCSPTGSGKARWFLTLYVHDLEDIVAGRMSTLRLYCCENMECGHKSSAADDHCECDYFDDPHFGKFEFPAAITALQHFGIAGLTGNSTKEDVLALLGPPQLAGGGEVVRSLGYIHPWITYVRSDCQIRFEFNKSQRIRLVSILDPDWKPGER